MTIYKEKKKRIKKYIMEDIKKRMREQTNAANVIRWTVVAVAVLLIVLRDALVYTSWRMRGIMAISPFLLLVLLLVASVFYRQLSPTRVAYSRPHAKLRLGVDDNGICFSGDGVIPEQPGKTVELYIRYADITKYEYDADTSMLRLYGNFQSSEKENEEVKFSNAEKDVWVDVLNTYDADILDILQKHGVKEGEA